MNRRTAFGVMLGVLVAIGAALQGAPQAAPQGGAPPAGGERHLTRAALEDKVRGGWAGQMIGVSYGQETEFKAMGKILEGPLPAWSPDLVERALDQDDLYVEMTFMEVIQRLGLEATTQDYGEAFKSSQYMLWHANAAARRLLNRGVPGGMSGDPKYNIHANDIDFQIEADFIGLMTPGLPQAANRFSDRVGRVMNYGDGLYGGMFVAGLYSAGYFENDPRRVVEQALASLPPGSGYAAVIRDVLEWSRANPDDWRKTWQQIETKWNKDD
ncbi:MAG: ADP-ribosylglycohydrolase family protein, partial [Acidobacteria bacterium]|nr:ADP-ribosylglycohydrolase family protein [Acidobacteriota bacterium]